MFYHVAPAGVSGIGDQRIRQIGQFVGTQTTHQPLGAYHAGTDVTVIGRPDLIGNIIEHAFPQTIGCNAEVQRQQVGGDSIVVVVLLFIPLKGSSNWLRLASANFIFEVPKMG